MNETSILVVEDETDVQELIVLLLKREGYHVDAVSTGEEAIRQYGKKNYRCVVLDWMLPGISGMKVCHEIAGKIPILMLTARAESSDITKGLDQGADDYLTKPFDISVFLARIRALLRRTHSKTSPIKSEFQSGPLMLDTKKHKVACNEIEMSLTASEFKLLTALFLNQGHVMSREALVDQVQGEDVNVTLRTVDTHIFGIRKKLTDCSPENVDLIETIRGIGYKIK
jgi:two-component system, OmpR family, phosphate regulon response regulator PhoB